MDIGTLHAAPGKETHSRELSDENDFSILASAWDQSQHLMIYMTL